LSTAVAKLCSKNLVDVLLFLDGQVHREHWSDLMAVSCSCVLDKGMQSPARVGGMANLVEIFRLNIVNPVTEGLISTIGSKSVRPNDDEAPLTFGEDDDEFFALLGTDNGRGVARMLGTYPLMFGCKVIQKVLVGPWSQPPNICWAVGELKGVPKPSPHPLSHKAARKERQQQKRADKEDRPSKG
jgi:hypothetical protein